MSKAFARFHPFPCLCYYLGVIFLATMILSPLFLLLGLSLVIGVNYSQDRGRRLGKMLKFFLFFAVFIAVLNPIFSHRGMTILGYLGDNPITLEAVVYGVAMAMSLLVILCACSSFNLVITSDKFLFLFGKVAQKSALIAMMAIGFVPKLSRRLGDIQVIQRAKGLDLRQGGLQDKAKVAMETVGTLVGWTLEEGVITAQSMNARGYGLLKKRTSYHRFLFTKKDGFLLGGIVFLSGGTWLLWQRVGADFAIYPQLQGLSWGAGAWLCLAMYGVLMGLPLVFVFWEQWIYRK